MGNLDDRASIDVAVEGVYGLLSVQRTEYPGQADFTVDDEVRQGTSLADAAKAAGVKHFVYTSVGGAERDPQLPSWKSKWKIEKHIRALALPATVLRPVAYMENYLSPLAGISTAPCHTSSLLKLSRRSLPSMTSEPLRRWHSANRTSTSDKLLSLQATPLPIHRSPSHSDAC